MIPIFERWIRATISSEECKRNLGDIIVAIDTIGDKEVKQKIQFILSEIIELDEIIKKRVISIRSDAEQYFDELKSGYENLKRNVENL
jgi:hypothetical protein